MLSMGEISQKKRDRRLLTAERFALEEAVERRVCGDIYDRIWRHRSTDDEARDESLRSKTATLKVVGVTIQHLGVSGVSDEGMIEGLTPARDGMGSPGHISTLLHILNPRNYFSYIQDDRNAVSPSKAGAPSSGS